MRKSITNCLLLTISIALALSGCKGNKNSKEEQKIVDSLSNIYEDAGKEPSFKEEKKLLGHDFSIKTYSIGDKQELIVQASQTEGIYTESLFAPISKTEVADLNGDAAPELIIHIDVPGKGAYKFVKLIGTAGGKLKEIAMPNIGDNTEIAAGYMGEDEYKIVDGGIERRFPIYEQKQLEMLPTGKHRTIRYKMQAVEGKEHSFELVVESHNDSK